MATVLARGGGVGNGKFLESLCTDAQYAELQKFLSNSQQSHPSDFEAKLKIAKDLHQIGNLKFENEDMKNTEFFSLAALHYLDFSPTELSGLASDERQHVNKVVVPTLGRLSAAIHKTRGSDAGVIAADFGLDILDECSSLGCSFPTFTKEEAELLRIELHFSRALAKGDQRDFEGAHEDASRVLHLCEFNLSQDQEKVMRAKRVARNSRLAQKRERRSQKYRWKGSLDAEPKEQFHHEWVPTLLSVSTSAIMVIVAAVLFRVFLLLDQPVEEPDALG